MVGGKQTIGPSVQLPVETSELPKYRNLEITKVKKSRKKAAKVQKTESFAFNDIQPDLEALMKEEVNNDMDEQNSIQKEAELDQKSNLEEFPPAAPQPPSLVALEGSPSTGTATGWAETPTLPQGWKYRFIFNFSHLVFVVFYGWTILFAVFFFFFM